MKVHGAVVPVGVRERRDSRRGLMATVTARTRNTALLGLNAGHGKRPDRVVIRAPTETVIGRAASQQLGPAKRRTFIGSLNYHSGLVITTTRSRVGWGLMCGARTAQSRVDALGVLAGRRPEGVEGAPLRRAAGRDAQFTLPCSSDERSWNGMITSRTSLLARGNVTRRDESATDSSILALKYSLRTRCERGRWMSAADGGVMNGSDGVVARASSVSSPCACHASGPAASIDRQPDERLYRRLCWRVCCRVSAPPFAPRLPLSVRRRLGQKPTPSTDDLADRATGRLKPTPTPTTTTRVSCHCRQSGRWSRGYRHRAPNYTSRDRRRPPVSGPRPPA